MKDKIALPIDIVLPAVIEAFKTKNRLVLTALPGSGKTTRIPLALLEEPWLEGKKIVMLEPRRLAAKSTAVYMAGLLGEKAGGQVGYRMRQDTKVSNRTRLEIVTEGVLTRMLQNDQALEGVGLIIFDEFHERSIHADLGLALVLETQELLRPDLRVLVMSATMDTAKVSELMGQAPVIEGSGLIFPVETVHLEKRRYGDWMEMVESSVLRALQEQAGDILVFLPGAGEIRLLHNRLSSLAPHIRIAPLYGALPQEEQEWAIRKSKSGEQKVVLSTSIAETSLTVEGVRVVIDGGLMRVPRFCPQTGLTRLETVQVTLAAADQRRGRAGRLEPGVCYRLWTKEEEQRFKKQNTPEILEADLKSLALELAVWGVQNPDELKWLDAPQETAFSEAKEMLKKFGALDEGGRITAHGQAMAALSTEPRLAHMLLTAKSIGLGTLACDLAALLEERDILLSRDSADLRVRIEALSNFRLYSHAGIHAHLKTCQRSLASSKRYQEMLGIEPEIYDIEHTGLVLAFAYPDRIAAGKGEGRFLLRSGRGTRLTDNEPIAKEAYIAIYQLDDKGCDSRIFLAAPIKEWQLKQYFSREIQIRNTVWWDSESQMVRAACREMLDEIILREFVQSEPPAAEVTRALLDGIRREGLLMLPWHKADCQLKERIAFLHYIDKDWPDVSDENLLNTLEEWLLPYVSGMKRKAELQQVSMHTVLLGLLSWEQQQKIVSLAPTHIVVPSGQRVPVDYTEPEKPILAVRLQEMFGLIETPRIAGGRAQLTLHLLSPARRPVQVTQDLAGFWQNAYFAVKKDLAGRYPRHYWPDNPLEAMPTNRTKPRK